MLEKGKNLVVFMDNGLSMETLTKTVKLYSSTTNGRLLPSLSFLIIGIASSVGRSIAVAEAAAATAAAASTLWIPIVGWSIFGVTALVSAGWIAYSFFKKENSIKLALQYTAKNNKKIADVLVFEDLSNGRTENKKLTFNNKKLSYEIELVNKIISPDSAFLSVKCIMILSDGTVSVEEIAEKMGKKLN